ncbi:MAG: Uma2 family endonuclease [Pyrinomonadaceae bacterium]
MSVQAVSYHDVIEQLPVDSTLILHDKSWQEYEELLEEVGAAKGLRISYDQGALQIMILSTEHEKYSYLINSMVSLLSIRLRIKVLSFGSATMKKQRQNKGAEPDACFYVQRADSVGRKKKSISALIRRRTSSLRLICTISRCPNSRFMLRLECLRSGATMDKRSPSIIYNKISI